MFSISFFSISERFFSKFSFQLFYLLFYPSIHISDFRTLSCIFSKLLYLIHQLELFCILNGKKIDFVLHEY